MKDHSYKCLPCRYCEVSRDGKKRCAKNQALVICKYYDPLLGRHELEIK